MDFLDCSSVMSYFRLKLLKSKKHSDSKEGSCYVFVDDNQEQTVLPLQSLDCTGTKANDVIEANGGVDNASSMLPPHIIQVTFLNNFSYLLFF